MEKKKKECEASKQCKYYSKIYIKRSNCFKNIQLHKERDVSLAVEEFHLMNVSYQQYYAFTKSMIQAHQGGEVHSLKVS